MSDQEILEKAMQKAIDGGWKPLGWEDATFKVIESDILTGELFAGFDITRIPTQGVGFRLSIAIILTSHDFAKALWGEAHEMKRHRATRFFPEGSIHCTSCGVSSSSEQEPCWKYHLQNMVIAEDPIKYLGEHLND